jgi:hypothetical protein
MWTGNEAITIKPSFRRKGRFKGRRSKAGFIAVKYLAEYFKDVEHPNHKNKVVAIRSGFIGRARSVGDLQEIAINISSRIPGKSGRPLRNCGMHFEARCLAGIYMSESEKDHYAQQKIIRLGIAVGMWTWHDHVDGSSDLHILALNKSLNGGVLQGHHDPGIRRKHLAISDAIEAELQMARIAKNKEMEFQNVLLVNQRKQPQELLPLFIPMPQRRKEISIDGRHYLAKRVARSAARREMKEWDHISANLAILVADRKMRLKRRGKLNGRDYISVQLDPKLRSKRFYLSELEQDVMAILREPLKLAEILVEEDAPHMGEDELPEDPPL